MPTGAEFLAEGALMSDREGCLRREYGDWYPGLEPGVWYTASSLAQIVLQQRRSQEPSWEFEDRVPSDRHFTFRGGDAGPRSGTRTRQTDGGGTADSA
jgi:hypothetical protein